MSTAFAPRPSSWGYRHEALLWDDPQEFLSAAVPFVSDGLAAGEPVLVALTPPTWEILQRGLGGDATRVERLDMTGLGANPARLIPAWLDFIEEHRSSGSRMRGIGEPVWPGRTRPEVDECLLNEALFNTALPADTPLWLLCPYQESALDADVLAEVHRTHPELSTGPGRAPSRTRHAFAGKDWGLHLAARELPAVPAAQDELTFGHGDLSEVRQLVRAHAGRAGLDRRQTENLVLSVNELAANSIDHGGGTGSVRAWRQDDALVFEVRDAGHLEDLLVGRRTPTPDQPRGRGLWLVNRLSDLVQLRTSPAGTTVRVTTWL